MSAEIDYYEALELSHTAENEDIRRAYKRLALKFHPDRNNGDLHSAERFKRIGEAYEILNDPEKRAHYDAYGKLSCHEIEDESPLFDAHHAEDIFSAFFGGFAFGRFQDAKPSEIILEIDVTLEDLYCGVLRHVEFSRKRHCVKCQGSGLSRPDPQRLCNTCNGMGTTSSVRKRKGFTLVSECTCEDCGGSGEIVREDDICRHCKGRGVKKEKRKLRVEILPGTHEDELIHVDGEGHQLPGASTAGDIIIVMALKPHQKFVRKGDTLILKESISLIHALSARSIHIQHLDGRILRLHTCDRPSPVTPFPTCSWVAIGEGMPVKSTGGLSKGNLLIHVEIKMPNKVINRSQLSRSLSEALSIDTYSIRGLSSAGKEKKYTRCDPELIRVQSTLRR